MNDGYILKLDEKDNLCNVLNQLKHFVPKKYQSNNKSFVKTVDKIIMKYL